MKFIRETKDIIFLLNFIARKTEIWVRYKKMLTNRIMYANMNT